MPRYMDFHQDLKLPADAIEQIASDTRNAKADQFGVRQVELYHNPEGQVYCPVSYTHLTLPTTPYV